MPIARKQEISTTNRARNVSREDYLLDYNNWLKYFGSDIQNQKSYFCKSRIQKRFQFPRAARVFQFSESFCLDLSNTFTGDRKLLSDFFQSVVNDGNLLHAGTNRPPSARDLQDAMNAQIRALTKGDVTKEKEILAMDCWRALTELDAQAREYEEIQRTTK